MNTLTFRRSIRFIIALALIATLSACSGESNDQSGSAAGGGSSKQSGTNGESSASSGHLTGLDREAHDYILAKLDEHWLKTADGWTTQFEKLNIGGEVMPGRPDTLYRQLRNITVSLNPQPLSESQRLNGSDYRAEIEFATTALRQFNLVDVGMGPPGWTPWEETYPGTIAIERRNGKWIISETDMFTWIKPKAEELAAAK